MKEGPSKTDVTSAERTIQRLEGRKKIRRHEELQLAEARRIVEASKNTSAELASVLASPKRKPSELISDEQVEAFDGKIAAIETYQ